MLLQAIVPLLPSALLLHSVTCWFTPACRLPCLPQVACSRSAARRAGNTRRRYAGLQPLAHMTVELHIARQVTFAPTFPSSVQMCMRSGEHPGLPWPKRSLS